MNLCLDVWGGRRLVLEVSPISVYRLSRVNLYLYTLPNPKSSMFGIGTDFLEISATEVYRGLLGPFSPKWRTRSTPWGDVGDLRGMSTGTLTRPESQDSYHLEPQISSFRLLAFDRDQKVFPVPVSLCLLFFSPKPLSFVTYRFWTISSFKVNRYVLECYLMFGLFALEDSGRDPKTIPPS